MERCAPPELSSTNDRAPEIRGSARPVARGRIELPTYRFSGEDAHALCGRPDLKGIRGRASSGNAKGGSSCITGLGWITAHDMRTNGQPDGESLALRPEVAHPVLPRGSRVGFMNRCRAP